MGRWPRRWHSELQGLPLAGAHRGPEDILPLMLGTGAPHSIPFVPNIRTFEHSSLIGPGPGMGDPDGFLISRSHGPRREAACHGDASCRQDAPPSPGNFLRPCLEAKGLHGEGHVCSLSGCVRIRVEAFIREWGWLCRAWRLEGPGGGDRPPAPLTRLSGP